MAEKRESFDVSSLLADLNKEFSSNNEKTTVSPEPQVEKTAPAPVAEPKQVEEPEQETPVETEVEDSESEELSDEELAEVAVESDEEEPVEENSAPVVNDPDVHKRNEAFKKLREEKDKLAESDKFLSELAESYGLSKEDMITKIRQDQLAKKAKAQGLPVEQFQKMQTLEKEVAEIKSKYLTESFNLEAEKLVRKYDIPQGEIETIFNKIGATGLDVLNNPKLLEVAYKAINYEVALEKGRQKQLEESKKRRETTTSPTLGTKGTNVDTSATDMDAEIDKLLKEKLGK